MIHLLIIFPVIVALVLGVMAWYAARASLTSVVEQSKSYQPLSVVLAMLTLLSVLGLLSMFWWQADFDGATQQLQLLKPSPDWLMESSYSWMPSLGASWYVALDGLSLGMLAIVAWLGLITLMLYRRHGLSVSICLSSQSHSSAWYVPCLVIVTVVSAMSVLLAVDMLLLVVAWFVCVLAYYALWSHVRHVDMNYLHEEPASQDHVVTTQGRTSPSSWLILTQMAGLAMLVAVLVLVVVNYNQTQQFGFGYVSLLSTVLPNTWSVTVWLCFSLSVLVLLPMIGLHLWQVRAQQLPAHVMSLSLVLLVLSVYVLWRFVLPLFPEVNAMWANHIRILAIVSHLYAAVMAFSVAGSLSHTQASSGSESPSDVATELANDWQKPVMKSLRVDSTAFLGYVAMCHGAIVLFAVYVGKLLSWQSVLPYLLTVLMGIAGLYVLDAMLRFDRIRAERSNISGSRLGKSQLAKICVLFFASAAAALPIFGLALAEFQLIASVFAKYPIQAALVMLTWLLLAVAMGRYVFSVFVAGSQPNIKTNISLSENNIDSEAEPSDISITPTEQQTGTYWLEWAALVLMAVVIVKTAVQPQKLMDTSYEALRWIHHVYTHPRELHGSSPHSAESYAQKTAQTTSVATSQPASQKQPEVTP